MIVMWQLSVYPIAMRTEIVITITFVLGFCSVRMISVHEVGKRFVLPHKYVLPSTPTESIS